MRPLTDSLLDASGWIRSDSGIRIRGDQPLRLTLRSVGSGDNSIEQLIQADLRAVGIDLRIEQMELGAFLADARSPRRSYDLLLTGIPGDLSLSHVAAMFESSQRGGTLDYAGYHDAQLDALFAATRAATSDSALVQIWRAIDVRLDQEAPAAWVYHARGVQGLRRRVRGVTMDLRGELEGIARWRIDP
jgi:peptide/nickel transport system substrate-binding protein